MIRKKRALDSEEEEVAPATVLQIPNGLRNVPLQVHDKRDVDYPRNLFKLHTLSAFFGSRGSGKTNACVNLAKAYLDYGSFNRVFIISPTYETNRIFEVLHPDPEDVYTDISHCQESLRNILQKIEKMKKEYDAALHYAEVYERWLENRATDADIALLEKMDYEEPEEDLEFPSPLLIIDDMSNTDLYSTSRHNPFINLCLRHRHVHQVGLTIFMLVQNFRVGVPKCLRQNMQQFFIWRTQDATQLQACYAEFANLCPYEEFERIYHTATDDDEHHFLTVDMNSIDPAIRFRKNFDEVIVIN